MLGEFFRVNRRAEVLSATRRASCRQWGHDTRSSHSVSLACRTLVSCNSPSITTEYEGVVPKVQTTSAKNAENGLLWAR